MEQQWSGAARSCFCCVPASVPPEVSKYAAVTLLPTAFAPCWCDPPNDRDRDRGSKRCNHNLCGDPRVKILHYNVQTQNIPPHVDGALQHIKTQEGGPRHITRRPPTTHAETLSTPSRFLTSNLTPTHMERDMRPHNTFWN